MDDVQMYEGSDEPGPSNEAHLHAQEQPAENEGGGQQGQVVASLYPPIPGVYARFTRQNIHRYRVLRDRLDDAMREEWNEIEPSERIKRQGLLLEEAESALAAERGGALDVDPQGKTENEQPSLLPAPDWDVMLEMGGPNVDWIEQDGYYSCFGDRWPIDEQLPNLQDTGVRQMYEPGIRDRRPTLHVLLRTLLQTYLTLIDQILLPPKEYYFRTEVPVGDDGPEGMMATQEGWRFVTQDIAGEINDIVVNFQHLLNELRPVQARETLRSTMEEQVKRRKEEAALIRRQCQAMRAEVQRMKNDMGAEQGKAHSSV
ncbi:hypothetical protein FA10DRAFT_267895 [Acaromyces ingoldii]|uniref:Mediator of RNA polymerase II transcription subunit 7 n=1 Tax=Acaromyces ingoldii TaxID=215250 RepID=A0A316YKJ0_9BASI|nr:hypothetical protein FA10DRAFT_267895 [Acaromyces ingoldii]PWN89324.1 hypothetical protein FA10DRAFT_267895 [Acaromyces ingoldii]